MQPIFCLAKTVSSCNPVEKPGISKILATDYPYNERRPIRGAWVADTWLIRGSEAVLMNSKGIKGFYLGYISRFLFGIFGNLGKTH